MKKIFFLILFGLLINAKAFSQQKTHKIVFQLASADTLVHKALIRQIDNVLEYWPNAIIEIVVHNEGINFVEKQKSVVSKHISEIQTKGITIAVCKNTMKRKKLIEEDILPKMNFVPVGIAEIAEKQENGYSYIKAGF